MGPLSMARAMSEHSLDVAEPCLPSIRHVDWKTVSREGHGWDRGRKEEVPEGQRRRREDGHQSDKDKTFYNWMMLSIYSSEPQVPHLCNGLNIDFI